MVEFKRGDGVLFVGTSITSYLAAVEAGKPREAEVWTILGVATSVTREGQLKAYRDVRYPDSAPTKLHSRSKEGYASQYRLPASDFDIDAVAEYCRNRPWAHSPEHLGAPFDSLEQARTELRQFKKEQQS